MSVPHGLEIAGRVAFIYLLLLALVRIGGRKELAEMTPMDLLTMLLLSETVSPALTGGDNSLPAGIIASVALIGLTLAMGWATFRFRWFERIVEGRAEVLIDDGKAVESVLRRQRITDEQLKTALHQEGLSSVDEVAKAFIEPSGKITFVKKKN